jgi:predicted O-linked N-acetylglucosamine transferase (SPINDLY family)
MQDALLTPQVWHLLCHAISRVNNSILLIQTASVPNSFQATPVSFALDLEAMRTSFESHGIHRSRLLFVPREPQSDATGVMMAVSVAAAADVVVDFSASSIYALAVAAPVSSCALAVVNCFEAAYRY